MSYWDLMPGPATARVCVKCEHCGLSSTIPWPVSVTLSLSALLLSLAAFVGACRWLSELPALAFLILLAAPSITIPALTGAYVLLARNYMLRHRL